MWIAYGLIWISVGIAVSVAVWVTKSSAPLWAMFIPLLIQLEKTYKEQ